MAEQCIKLGNEVLAKATQTRVNSAIIGDYFQPQMYKCGVLVSI